ncbi:MAG: sensor histidine kinase [Cytophagaceae bacterium]
MKFILTDRKFKKLPPGIQGEIREKLYGAERNIAHVRLGVVLLNIIVYLFFLDKTQTIEWLAWTVIVAAFVYSLVVSLFHPYRKYEILLTSYFTTSSDAALITLWILATGSYNSPFYLLWYVSILSIALRYTFRVTLIVSVLFSVLYALIVAADSGIQDHMPEMVIRISYLIFISFLAGIMSQETIDQIQAKMQIRKSEIEIRKREAALRQARDELEKRVKERTRELDESNKQLIKINEDLDNFVYSASHDLKSPIINVESLLGILALKGPVRDEESIEIEQKVQTSLDRIKRTIHHLSQVARTQKEIYEDVGPVKFEDIVAEVMSENEEIFRRAQVKLESDFSRAESMVCSRVCLKSILYNFMSNAVKYRSPLRTPHIRLATESSGKGLKLTIEDNGLGIDLDQNGSKLFMIFKRFHDHVEGTGIGLYMVKRLVERNQGSIEVESEVGKGTTFTLYFRNAGIPENFAGA